MSNLAGARLRIRQVNELQLGILAGDRLHRTASLMRQEAGVEGRQRLDQRLEQLACLLGGQHVGGIELMRARSASSNSQRSSPIRRHWSSYGQTMTI